MGLTLTTEERRFLSALLADQITPQGGPHLKVALAHEQVIPHLANVAIRHGLGDVVSEAPVPWPWSDQERLTALVEEMRQHFRARSPT